MEGLRAAGASLKLTIGQLYFVEFTNIGIVPCKLKSVYSSPLLCTVPEHDGHSSVLHKQGGKSAMLTAR